MERLDPLRREYRSSARCMRVRRTQARLQWTVPNPAGPKQASVAQPSPVTRPVTSPPLAPKGGRPATRSQRVSKTRDALAIGALLGILNTNSRDFRPTSW